METGIWGLEAASQRNLHGTGRTLGPEPAALVPGLKLSDHRGKRQGPKRRAKAPEATLVR